MKKKVTIKDIAREAGVSVATVSYVLNDRKDQKISEATKNKVLQIVNLFNYTGNASARNLASGKTYNIALFVGQAAYNIGGLDEIAFVNKLTARLAVDGYDLVYHGLGSVEAVTNVDGIIFHGTDSEFFRQVSPLNLAPIVLVDMVVGDALFYEINTQIANIGELALNAFNYEEFKLIIPQGLNSQLRSRLRRIYQCVEVASMLDIKNFITANPTTNLVVYGVHLAELVQTIKPQAITFDHLTVEKIEVIWASLRRAMNREEILHNAINI